MSALNHWINKQIGLSVTPEFETNVKLALQETAKQLNLSVDELSQRLIGNSIDPRLFIEKIVTNESFFFRYGPQMEAAVKQVIEPLIRQGRTVDILCLPCSHGQEPYSLAMVMHSLGVNLNRVNITGIDVSHRCVEYAKQGVYSQYAFRRTTQQVRATYFTALGNDRYQLSASIMRAVEFKCLNLFDSFKLSNTHYDLIFFNNLLIYFDKAHVTEALTILKDHLAKDGWLLADSAESPRCREVFVSQSMGEYFAFRHRDYVDRDGKGQTLGQHGRKTEQTWLAQRQSKANKVSPQASLKRKGAPLSTANSISNKENNSPERLIEKAKAAAQGKRFDEAISLYERVIKESPLFSLSTRVALSQLYADKGDTLQAMEMAEQVLREVESNGLSSRDKPSNRELADLHGILALGLRSKGLNDAANQQFEFIQSLDCHHPLMKLYRPEGRP